MKTREASNSGDESVGRDDSAVMSVISTIEVR